MLNAKIETNSFVVTLVPQDDQRVAKKVRVYAPYTNTDDLVMPEHSIKGEDKELDAAWRAYNKIEIERQRYALEDVFAELVDLFDRPTFPGRHACAARAILEQKLRFSRKAGCGCGCSPGFVGEAVVSSAFKVMKDGEYSWTKPVLQLSISRKRLGPELPPA